MKTTLLSIVFMIFSIAVNGQSINEVMYDPVSNDGVGGEYIELYGTPGTDIGCYMVSDGDWVVVIPNGTTIPADGFFVIANAPLVDGDSTDVDLDVSTCACNSDPNNYITLTNSGEFVALFDNAGNILDGIIFEENVVGNSNAPSGQVLTPTNPGLCTNGDLTIPSLANLTSPPAPWSYLGDNVVDGSIDVVPDGSDGWGDSSTQGVMGNSMGATNAVASCSITAITLNNISACNNLGTADSTDDQFTYDVTVTYNNAPSTGNLLIRLYDANGTQISAHPIAFDPNQTSVTVTDLIAGTIDIADLTITAVAQFSADATCQITNTNAGTSPAPCSVACGLGSFLGVDCLDQGTECNSDDVISLRVNASNSGAGPTNQYNVIIAGTTYGPYDYDVQNLIPISPLLSASESVTITDVDNNACTSTNNIPLNGCSAYDQPPISVSSNSPLCEKETIMLFEAGGAANVTWAWTGPLGFTSSDQNPTIANATPAHSGDYDVIVTAPGGCTSTQTTTVTVNPLPVVDITTPDTSVCDSSGSFQIAATPAGGVFSGPNVSSTGEFDADAASAGTYSIVYSYQDPATRCTNTDTINITVNALPVVTAGGYGTPCLNAPVIDLTGGNPPGGTFTGAGVSGTTFDPAVAGVGNHTITYSYTDPATGCSATASTNIEVLDVANAPNPIDPIEICDGDDMPEIAPTSGNAGTPQNLYNQTFDTDGEGAVGPQPATVTPPADSSWSINGDLTGLTATSDYFQTIGGQLVAQDLDSTVCFQTMAIDISGMTNVSLSIDISETGDHEAADFVDVKYTIDGIETTITNWMGAGSSTHTLVGDTLIGGTYSDADWGSTTVTQSGLSGNTMIVTVCALNNAGSENIMIDNVHVEGTPGGGPNVYAFWSSDPSNGNGTILANQVATYTPTTTVNTSPDTIWVTVPTPNGCHSDPVAVLVTVDTLPTVDAGTYAPTCVNTTVPLSGTPSGGTFSGTGVNGSDFTSSTAGTFKVYYSYTNGNGCTNIDSADIVVNDLPVVTLAPFADVCLNAPSFALSGGDPAGGTYSGTGVTAGNFDPATAGVGTHTITYTYTDSNGCTNSATSTIDVLALPDAPTIANIEGCEGISTLLTPSVPGSGVSCAATGDLIITGIIDGPLSGGTPKAIEFYAVNDIADLSAYGFGSANNGGGSDGEEFTFPADAVTAGTYFWLATETTNFTAYFGFAPTYTHFSAGVNGDDAVELFHNGVAIDVFGDINTDGTGQPWEYQDGWAYRNSNTGQTTSFDPSDWSFSGPNALDGTTTNTTFPISTYQCVGGGVTYNFYDADPTGGMATLLAGGVNEYDPGTTPATSPQEIWVTTNDGTCESEPVMVTITIHENPSITASSNSPICADSTLLLTATGGSAYMSWAWTGPNGYTSNDQNPTRPNATADMSGTYQVIGTNEFQCSDTALTEVQVISLDAPVVDDIVACDGDTVTIDLSFPTTPQPIFTEDFDEANIGLTGPCPNGNCASSTTPSNNQWSLSGDVSGLTASSDYFRTIAGALVAQDLDNELCFLTQVIDISNYSNVEFSIDISETGDHELIDYADVTFIVDGVPTLITDWNNLGTAFHTLTGDHPDDGDWGSTTVTQSGINGSTLQIQVCVLNNAGSEDIYIDNVHVSGIQTSGAAYNFYDADPAGGNANLLAGSVYTYDVVPVFNAPFSIWISSVSAMGCESDAIEVNVTALPLPTVYDAELSNCEDTTGKAQFYLEEAIPTITGGDDTYTVTFYASEADALAQVDSLTSPYSSTSTTIYANVTNLEGCHAIAALTLTTFNCTAEITDPCACTSNGDRNFLETIEINSPAGQVWTVTAVNGLLINGTPPQVGFVPQESPAGVYVFTGTHHSGDGYTLTVTNQHGFQLDVANTCYYPDPVIEDVYDEQIFCLGTNPFDLAGNAGGAAGTGSFDIDGNPATTFDPMLLGAGLHTITYTFDAGQAGSNDPTDPGCVESTSVTVEVATAPTVLVCNSNLQVVLDENCEAVLDADQFLEGDGCYDDFEVEIIMPGTGQHMGSVANGSMIGSDWDVMVTNTVGTSNPCWSHHVTFVDMLAPTIACQDTFKVTCSYDLNLIPQPTASDNCDPNPTVTLVSEDVVNDNICDAQGRIITRTWKAKDNNGLSSATCTQVIQVTREPIAFPENITWTCDQWADYPGILDANPLNPAITDFDTNDNQNDIDVNPNTANNILGNTGSGVPTGWDGQFCAYNLAPPVDQIVEHCGGTKIFRTWSIFDECAGGEPIVHTQVIIVEDRVAPTMDFSAAPFGNDNGTIFLQVSTENAAQYPNYCTSVSPIALPTFDDNCAGVDMSTLKVFTAAGQTVNGHIPAPGLNIGNYDLTYQIADICGNIREMTIQLRVVDDIPPTMICDQITKVSLENNGIGKLFANNPDDGSHDNCSIDHFEIRRMSDNCGIDGNTTFDDIYDNGEYVTFCCDDITTGTNNTHTVVVRGYDVYGNYGECMVDVLVEDKIAPKCTAPADVVVDCNMYDPSFAPYGTATAWDNCSATLFENPYTGGVDACNTGTIYRSWTARDAAGLEGTCTQKITVNYVEDFKVKFPNDQLSDVCNALSDTIFPTFIDKDCELAGYSYYDEKITNVPNACFKILRHWNIYDWCDYDENYTPVQVTNPENSITGPTVQATPANHGRFAYTQVIMVIDNDAPTVTCLPADGLCNALTGCYSNVTLKAEATDACSRDDIVFGYTLYLDTDGDGTMETVIDDDDPGAYLISVAYPDGIKAVASVQINGLNFANHKIKWYAHDGCGNIDQCEYEFETKDCKPPTILVDNGSAVNLMPVLDGNGNVTGGMIRVWPGNPANCNLPDPNVCGWDPSVGDNCTSDDILLNNLRIRRIYPGVPTPTTPPTGLYVDFTCADVGSQQVQIWTSDEAGNWAHTETYILIEDPDLICAPGAPIAGALHTEAGAGVQDADVTVAEASGNIPAATVTTPSSGEYSVNGLPLAYDYTVTPIKDGSGTVATNGVNVIDLLRIYQAILGNTFTSPYQELAADVNGDGEVNITDLLIIRNLTLGKIDKFPNMTAWRFFEEGCNTATSDCEVIDILNLQSAVTDANFIGVKMGDVAAPFASPNQYASVDDRSYGEFVLNTADRMINAGEEVKVTLHANRNDIAAYQFTLELGGLEFVGVTGENVSFENNFAYHNDAITVSWNGERVSDDVFTITLRATNDVRLSEALSLDGRITEAMAADTDAMRQDVHLAFDGKVVDQFTLFQNEPNPFSDRTDIQFYLPEATSATLTVYDASGRALKTVNGDYAKGMNTISVAKSDLNVAGVLYYKLETTSNSAIRKMIIME